MIDVPATIEPSDEWAVETHGLTKRFGENIAVNDVELFGAARLCLWLPRAKWRWEEDANQNVARSDAGQFRHDVSSRRPCSTAP